ncbi:ComEA family DNA-binding protein [Demequina activiva]|uniref:Soluble ligand binding domain-containing protein n=1 Tax=Demequina activiva TaxID=1582364 RepID=A0A919Q3A9_9MICO|nr:ComEA family DNA-binding protein [Demequina activiva]GIG55470.1 hypothetical protein Dac01nite_22220 [Demequina activiva]
MSTFPPQRLPDDDALDRARDAQREPPQPDLLRQWRESAARAAGRAYEAAYGREIPETSATVRWTLSPRVAATVAVVLVAVGAVAWWLAGPGRGAPVGLDAPSASDPVTADPGHQLNVTSEGTETVPPAVIVHVSGAVAEPGLVEVPGGSRVADVIASAGGLLAAADQAGVNLAREAVDGEHVHVPTAGEQADATGPLSVNAASAAQLEELPGVGPVIAERIVADRDAHGPFTSLDDLQRVSGVGPALVAQWEGLAQV